jgi:hypothetical protein
LAVAAKSESAGGEIDLALADCRRIYAVAGHAGEQPLLISDLVSLANDVLASKTLAAVLPFVTAKQQLAGFAVPDAHVPVRRFVRCLRGEEAFSLAASCNLASGDWPYVSRSSLVQRYGYRGMAMWLLWLHDAAESERDYFQQLRKLMNDPYYRVAADLERLDQQQRSRARVMAPSLFATIRFVTAGEALRSAVGVALAATGYRLDHGGYPDKIYQLVPQYLDAVTVDPFDGKPLRLKKNADGSLVIYSVGPDQVDNGGQVETKGSGRPADVGIILRRP